MTKLFQAGIVTSNFDRGGSYYAKLDPVERRMRDSVENYLESYHYIHKPTAVKKVRRDGLKVFLDSGAFSAYTQGVVIDIGKYCDYCHENADIIRFPSVLDAIGDYKGTYKNQMEMERRGVKPLPCYHFGEPEEVLEHYVKNYDYITIGGMVPISTKQLMIWLDRIWPRYLCNADGSAKIKVHGFGLTSLPLMQRYPWFSVDSSTWVQWGAMGFILMPVSGRQLNISARSAARKVAGQHVDNISDIERQAIEKELTETGIDTERLRIVNYPRWAWNAWAFPEYLRLRGGGCTHFKEVEQHLF